jgi:hypothetical protein
MAEKYIPLQEKFWMIEKELGIDALQWMGDNYHTFCKRCQQTEDGEPGCRINSFKKGRFSSCWAGENITVGDPA